MHPGVYATFTGPLPPMTRVWAALLHAGEGAAAGGTTALWLWGVLPEPPQRLTVCVPERRRVVHRPGARVCRVRALADRVHPSRLPSRLRIEEAVLDVADATKDVRVVVETVLRATSGRRTTAHRLREALARRSRQRHRRLLEEILGEVEDGVQSALERRYRRDVERAHGLPHGTRNRPEPMLDAGGRTVRSRYRDIRYRRWRLVVELDGLQAHPEWLRRLDRLRDNSIALTSDDQHLEYGWAETVGEPCRLALEVATVLRRHGWTGRPVPCGPGCALSM